MINNPLLQLAIFFTLFAGLYKTKEYNQTTAVPAPVQAKAPVENKQHAETGIWWIISVISDNDVSGQHDHKDAKLHYLSFDRIRRNPYGFSIRCACVKTLLVIIHLSLLLLMLCQFIHLCHV
jgi:hypothetical protein